MDLLLDMFTYPPGPAVPAAAGRRTVPGSNALTGFQSAFSGYFPPQAAFLPCCKRDGCRSDPTYLAVMEKNLAVLAEALG